MEPQMLGAADDFEFKMMCAQCFGKRMRKRFDIFFALVPLQIQRVFYLIVFVRLKEFKCEGPRIPI